MFETKSDIVRKLVSEKNYKKALRIAKDFRLGICESDADAMKRGYECMINPTFYRQIGIDTEFAIEVCIRTIENLYGKNKSSKAEV